MKKGQWLIGCLGFAYKEGIVGKKLKKGLLNFINTAYSAALHNARYVQSLV